jgi:hypothetical protein
MTRAGRVTIKRTQKAAPGTCAKCSSAEGSAGTTTPVTITINVLVNRRVILTTRFPGSRVLIIPPSAACLYSWESTACRVSKPFQEAFRVREMKRPRVLEEHGGLKGQPEESLLAG